MRRIVVGFDGSSEALTALAWAVDEAARREAGLTVLYAYPLPEVGSAEALPSDFDLRKAAERVLDEGLDRLDPPPGLRIERKARPVLGNPARALVDEARDAEMLVVGSRGHGGFMALLLGSVSEQCVSHAECPVVVVPGTKAASVRAGANAEVVG